MYTPHCVTLYNASENPETLAAEYNITILDGVFLDISQGANIEKTGLENADAARLFVPFAVDARDAKTGERQLYANPKDYEAFADKSRYWTLRSSGTGSAVDCFFVKGNVIEDPANFQNVNAKHDYVYRVDTIDIRDFGTESMWHFDVRGK